MALELSRFFDSIDKDKPYPAEEFAEYFRLFLSDGVWALGTNLQVTAAAGMTVSAGYGAAMIQGYGYWLKDNSTGAKQFTLSAGGAQPRIDRIILRLDMALATRSIVMAVLAGTPAATPVAPALTRAGNIYELSLAQIAVGAGVASISAGNIMDERGNIELCGVVQPKALTDNINQGVKTTDSPTFAALTVTGTVTANKIVGAVYN